MDQILSYTAVAVLFVLIVVFVPLATIWALNTLFALGIAYAFKTWLSVIILNITVFGSLSHLKGKAK